MGDYAWHNVHVVGNLDLLVAVEGDTDDMRTISSIIEGVLNDYVTENGEVAPHEINAGGEARMSSCEDIASELEEIKTQYPAAIIAYEVRCDPKYEYLGDLIYQAPGLPRFQASCDAEGNVVVGHGDITKVFDFVDEIDGTVASARAGVDALYGNGAYAAIQAVQCQQCLAQNESPHDYAPKGDG